MGQNLRMLLSRQIPLKYVSRSVPCSSHPAVFCVVPCGWWESRKDFTSLIRFLAAIFVPTLALISHELCHNVVCTIPPSNSYFVAEKKANFFNKTQIFRNQNHPELVALLYYYL